MIKTTPMDKEWLGRLKERGFTFDSVFDKGQHEDLKSKLLYFGGEAVILPNTEPDKDNIMERGILYEGQNSKLVRGRVCRCHQNCASLADFDNEMTIVVGYALSQDGVWRQHTWCIKDKTILETTERRVAYYGFELDVYEANQFIYANL